MRLIVRRAMRANISARLVTVGQVKNLRVMLISDSKRGLVVLPARVVYMGFLMPGGRDCLGKEFGHHLYLSMPALSCHEAEILQSGTKIQAPLLVTVA